MKLDVFTPEDHVGDVIGDLNRRRGMIQSSGHSFRWYPHQGPGTTFRDVRLHR